MADKQPVPELPIRKASLLLQSIPLGYSLIWLWLLIWNKIEKLKLIATFHFLYSALLPIESDLAQRNKNHLEEGDHLGQGFFFNVDPAIWLKTQGEGPKSQNINVETLLL